MDKAKADAKVNTNTNTNAKAKDKRQGKEERILHVIEVAKELLIKQGYTSTTTVQIAREAGIAELTLFRYFSTKRELFEAVIQPLINFEEFACALIQEKTHLQGSSLQKLIRERVEFVKREKDLVRLVIVESQFQEDLAGEFNPVKNVEGQVHKLLLSKGLTEEMSQVITQLIKGLLLSIVFTSNYGEQVIDCSVALIESQILHLLQGAQ